MFIFKINYFLNFTPTDDRWLSYLIAKHCSLRNFDAEVYVLTLLFD